MWQLVLRLFGSCIVFNLAMAWRRCVCVWVEGDDCGWPCAYTKLHPCHELLIVWPEVGRVQVVRWAYHRRLGDILPRTLLPLCFFSFLSYMTRASGRFMVPSRHNWCLVIPMSAPLVEGFRPSFEGAGVGGNSARKEYRCYCRYRVALNEFSFDSHRKLSWVYP